MDHFPVGYAWATNRSALASKCAQIAEYAYAKKFDDRRVYAHICKRVPMPENADQVKVANLVRPILHIGGVRGRTHNAWSSFAKNAS